MKLYKHYSFDLWMTLIKSNPGFKLQRTRFFFEHFNRKEKTLEETGLIFRQVDVMCNAINEKTGSNIHAEEMYLMVISAMNDYIFPLQDIDITKLYNDMEELVFQYLPVMYSVDTTAVLHRIKERGNPSFSLLSNTAFIKGSTLRKVLKHLEIDHYFSFQLYSDEVGMSKPNADFFQLLIKTTEETRGEKIADLKEIIHVGDNAMADIGGAEKVGISSLLINSNHLTISNLLH
jgi:putative hydrolase of the HAD superfamily